MLFTYLFIAVLTSWAISVYNIFSKWTRPEELVGQKFWGMQLLAMFMGLMWPLILFVFILVLPAFLFLKFRGKI